VLSEPILISRRTDQETLIALTTYTNCL